MKDLLLAVGKKCGVEAKVIDELDLETIVEHSIAVKEGKVLEEDSEAPPFIQSDPFPPQSPIYENVLGESFYNLNGPLKAQKVLIADIYLKKNFR